MVVAVAGQGGPAARPARVLRRRDGRLVPFGSPSRRPLGFGSLVLGLPTLLLGAYRPQGGQPQLQPVHHDRGQARKFAYQALLLEELARAGVRVEFVKGPRALVPAQGPARWPRALPGRRGHGLRGDARHDAAISVACRQLPGRRPGLLLTGNRPFPGWGPARARPGHGLGAGPQATASSRRSRSWRRYRRRSTGTRQDHHRGPGRPGGPHPAGSACWRPRCSRSG